MTRIHTINDTQIDLGNIKCIINDCSLTSNNGGYIIIKLLRGKEYVFNEEIGSYDLIEPEIKIYVSDYDKAIRWIVNIEQEWEKYLIIV